MTENSHVPSGYEIGHDEDGLTNRERDVRRLVGEGKTAAQIATEIGVTRQRVYQFLASLKDKGAIAKREGKWVVVEKGAGRG